MTGNMSGTVRSAESATSLTTADVTVLDSRFISKALSYQVVEAAKMAQALQVFPRPFEISGYGRGEGIVPLLLQADAVAFG